MAGKPEQNSARDTVMQIRITRGGKTAATERAKTLGKDLSTYVRDLISRDINGGPR